MYSFNAGHVRQEIWRIYQNLVMKSLISCCTVENRVMNFMPLFACRFVCAGIFLLSFPKQFSVAGASEKFRDTSTQPKEFYRLHLVELFLHGL
jgi:hypothetical protein